MRTTLTVLMAIALTIAIGVSGASAQVDLHVCKKKNGKQVRFVEDSLTDCTGDEDGAVWFAPLVDSIVLIDDSKFYARQTDAYYIACNVVDDGNNEVPMRMLSNYPFDVSCTLGQALASFAIAPYQDWDINQLNVSCIDVSEPGIPLPAHTLGITCTIDK